MAKNPPSTQQRVISQQSFQGPIPPPESFAKYEMTLPGAAERILSMAEQTLAHARERETKALDSDIRERDRARSEARLGQVFGFLIGIVAIVAGSVTAVLGQPLAGGFIGTGGVVGLVSVFVWGRSVEQKPPGSRQ